MEQEVLRKVSYKFGIDTESYDGFFHRWIAKKDGTNSEYAAGVIEDAVTGRVHEIPSGHITFAVNKVSTTKRI